MSLSDIIAIALGLAFTYALLSLLVSAAKEAIAGILGTRAASFRSALVKLLDTSNSGRPGLASLADRVYGHALVAGSSLTSAPSYVPARNFTLALIDVLANGSQSPPITAVQTAVAGLPPGPIREALKALATEAGGNLDTLKASIDKWFDDAMDRLSGNYKRWSQLILFVIGLCLAAALNVDTLKIVSTLEHDSNLRGALADQAILAAKGADQANKPIDDIAKEIAALPIPMGWTFCADAAAPVVGEPPCANVARVPLTHAILLADKNNPRELVSIIFGWLLTGIAISFGAPFWFDLLNQLANLRAVGPKPPRADAPAK